MEVSYDSGRVSSMYDAICKSIDRLATAETILNREDESQTKELYWKYKYKELQHSVDNFLYQILFTENIEEAIRLEALKVNDSMMKVVAEAKEKGLLNK